MINIIKINTLCNFFEIKDTILKKLSFVIIKITKNMNKTFCFSLIIFTLVCFQLQSQVNLKPSIGLANLPDDNDSIGFPGLNIDLTRTFENTGLKKGDTIPHFRLYTVNSEEYDIENILGESKPCLLIEGSYTCDVFRSKLPLIDSLQNEYGAIVNIFIVYTVEAHPDSPDVCPYMGMVWEVDTNKLLGIRYRQPVTYGQRKQIVSDLLNDFRFTVSVPILIDGPQNKFWNVFNKAPNSAFLIQPNGVIFNKHGWFDGFIGPDYNIRQDIEDLLKLLAIKSDHNLYPQISLFYNQNSLKISGLNKTEPYHLEIFDLNGKRMYSGQHTRYQVSLPELPEGLYSCKIISGTQFFTKKFVVNQ